MGDPLATPVSPHPWGPHWPQHYVPEQPDLPRLIFRIDFYHDTGLYYVTGIVVPSPAVASDQDTDLSILVALNGNPAIILDAGAPPGNTVTFPCNAGDTGVLTQVDVNIVGPSIASVALAFTVPKIVVPPTNVPTQPGVPTITFTDP